MKFKTKSMIATFIILLISGAAFFAGFLQEYYSGQVTDLREEATDIQAQLDRMEAKAYFQTQSDHDTKTLDHYSFVFYTTLNA